MLKHLPLSNPKPDAQRFVDVIMGRADGSRPPQVEYLVDDVLRKPITTDLLGKEWPGDGREKALDLLIEFWYRMGYDFVRHEMGLHFPRPSLSAAGTPADNREERGWADEHTAMISNWEEFEKYPWPKIEDVDFFPLEYINDHLPDGMGLVASHGGGPFEQLSGVMSLEGVSIAVIEQPDLVQAVSDKIGEVMEKFYEHLLQLDNLVMVFPGDDMGFRTQTLLRPDDLRRYTLPWHKRFAEMAHEKGLPYCLHSCGNILPIVEDLIEDVKLDGKHSYEEVIIPIQDFQERYGDRIAVLGGFDIHPLSTMSEDEVRGHVRFLTETCGPRGRFVIGSGRAFQATLRWATTSPCATKPWT